MDKNYKEYQRLFDIVDALYKKSNMGLRSEKPKNIFISFITNFTMMVIIGWEVYYTYTFIYEDCDSYIKAQQVWAALAILQIPARGMNRLVNWDEMKDLVKWYDEIYSKKLSPEYQVIVDRNLESLNSLINKGIV